jgi:hypothetical protein
MVPVAASLAGACILPAAEQPRSCLTWAKSTLGSSAKEIFSIRPFPDAFAQAFVLVPWK